MVNKNGHGPYLERAVRDHRLTAQALREKADALASESAKARHDALTEDRAANYLLSTAPPKRRSGRSPRSIAGCPLCEERRQAKRTAMAKWRAKTDGRKSS